MIDFSALAQVLVVFLPAMVSPGPDFLAVSSIAVARGRAEGIKAGAGIASACAIHTGLCLLGLAAIFAANPHLALGVEFVGGLYLVWVGLHIWKASLASKGSPAAPSAPKAKKTYGSNSFLAAFVVGVSNPKALAFFSSIFVGALPKENSPGTMIAIEILLPLCAVTWFAFVSRVLTVPRLHRRFLDYQTLMDRVVGTILGGFGVKMVISSGIALSRFMFL
ncbi:MAG: LysE family transporter [Alphaproteobacteria bacterium]|nr:LysE family transporter [Alphaproteobacteria bacterium]